MPVVRQAQTSPIATAGPLEASLDAPIARLALDSQALLAATAVPVGAVTPAGSPLIEFALGDSIFRMAIVESVADLDFDAVHLTLVDPASRDYARLTIARQGTEIVGTVFQGTEEFRILPLADGHQHVHPVALYRGDFRRARGPELESRAGQLEARHLQMTWVAERRPDEFETYPDGRLRGFEAGSNSNPLLGRIDVGAAMQQSAEGTTVVDVTRLARDVESFLDGIRHLTLVDDPVRVLISPDEGELGELYEGLEDDASIEFRQVIDGLTVDDENEIEIDRTGRVISFDSELVRSRTAEKRGESMSEQEAHAAGLAAIRETYAVDWPFDLRESELVYEPGGNDEPLKLIWRLTVGTSRCEPVFQLEMRASTGEVESLRWAGRLVRVGDRSDLNAPPPECVTPNGVVR